MGQKILILNPWGTDYLDSLALDVISPSLRHDTEVACVNLGDAAPPVPWPVDEGLRPTVELCSKAEADGFDAIMIACAGDPFLWEARAAVSIPVVGIAETAILSSFSRGKLAILGRRLPDVYTPLMPAQNSWDSWIARLARYGLTREDVVLRRVLVANHPDVETLERMTRDDPRGLRELMLASFADSLHNEGLEQCKLAVAEDGARCLFFACNFWSQAIAELGPAAREFGATLINPLVTAATYAEQLLLSGTDANVVAPRLQEALASRP